jgi:hypothetical protein
MFTYMDTPQKGEAPMAAQFVICQVSQTGPSENGEVYVNLTEKGGAFQNRWFIATPSKRREILATALAAITTGFNVNVGLDSPAADSSQIHDMYITRA